MKILTAKTRIRNMSFLILPIIAGLAIALQAAFSGKISTKVGSLETVVLIHFFGLVVALIIYMIRGNATFGFLKDINLLVVIAGSLGVLIIFFLTKSFVVNGASTTITISVVVQLIVSKTIDHFGILGVERSPVNMYQLLALIIIISGVVLFQYSK